MPAIFTQVVGFGALAIIGLLAIFALIFRGTIFSTVAWIAAGVIALVAAINTMSYGWGRTG